MSPPEGESNRFSSIRWTASLLGVNADKYRKCEPDLVGELPPLHLSCQLLV